MFRSAVKPIRSDFDPHAIVIIIKVMYTLLWSLSNCLSFFFSNIGRR